MSGKKLLLLWVSINIIGSVYCQDIFEVGIEGGFAGDQYKVSDRNGNLITIPCISGLAGINFRMYRNSNFFYEFAALAKQYSAGFALKQQSSNITNNTFTALLIPVRVGYNLNLSERVSLTPLLGIAPALKVANKEGGSGSMYENNNVAQTEWHYTDRPLNRNFYTLLQGGLGLELKPMAFPGLKFSLTANYYYQWLQTVTILYINYKVNNGPVETGNLLGKGRFLNCSAGIKYAFYK